MADGTPTDERVSHAPLHGVDILLESHRAFLAYLRRRVGSREVAEDILQDAFARSFEKVEALPDEAVVPWFYRTLRNAAIDYFRRQSTADKAFEAFAKEIETAGEPNQELHNEICACVTRLAKTLKPEYAEALSAIELNGVHVKSFAEEKGLSPSNAGVRIFRARQALRKQVVESCGTCAEHGCVDCTCRSERGARK